MFSARLASREEVARPPLRRCRARAVEEVAPARRETGGRGGRRRLHARAAPAVPRVTGPQTLRHVEPHHPPGRKVSAILPRPFRQACRRRPSRACSAQTRPAARRGSTPTGRQAPPTRPFRPASTRRDHHARARGARSRCPDARQRFVSSNELRPSKPTQVPSPFRTRRPSPS